MQFPRFWKINSENKSAVTVTPTGAGIQAFKIGEAASDGKTSSFVSDYDYSFAGRERVLRPPVDFAVQFEYYTSVGKVQSTIDAYVSEVRTRGYEFEGEDEAAQEKLQEWAKEYNLNELIEYMVRDLLICGNNIIGITDWKPVQMDRVVGLRRDNDGEVEDYVYSLNGKWEPLPLQTSQYIHSKFIDINRRPWGIGLFHALTTSFNWNNHESIPELELYRRHLQNVGQVEEKYAFPRVLYAFDGSTISDPELNKLKEQLKAQKPGERWLTTKVPELITETIDGARSGLLQTTTEIQNEEITAGLQSSVNRLRTQPSAMADAKESNTKDDAMLLYIFAKIEDIINTKIIPLIVGEGKDEEAIVFHFGQQDDMELNIQEITQLATITIDSKPVVSPEEVRVWIEQKGLPLDKKKYDAFLKEAEQRKVDQQQNQMDQIAAKQGGGEPFGGKPTKDDDKDVKDLQKEAYRAIIKAAIKSEKTA